VVGILGGGGLSPELTRLMVESVPYLDLTGWLWQRGKARSPNGYRNVSPRCIARTLAAAKTAGVWLPNESVRLGLPPGNALEVS